MTLTQRQDATKEAARAPGRPWAERLRRGPAVLAFAVAAGWVAGCAAPGVRPEQELVGDASSAQPPAAERPRFELPPLPERSQAELWRSATARADAMGGQRRREIAAVVPPPVPPEVTAAATAAPAPSTAPPVPAGLPPAPVAAPPVAIAPGAAGAAPRRAPVPSVRVVHKYTVETGLPSNRITALYVDTEDAWVGTADAGVARLNFAEGNWIVTRVEDGLTSNRITDIAKVKDLVFVGTQEGVSIWDGVSWKTETEVAGVPVVNPVFAVHEDTLWLSSRTMRGGLVTFDGATWRNRSTMMPGGILNNVSSLGFAGKDVWMGTSNRGVYRFDGKEWTTYTVGDGIASNFVYTLAVRGNTCFLGGCCGVSAFEGGTWRVYDIAEGLPHSTVNAIAVDGELVWFGSKKGLGLFDGFDFTNFYVGDGLTDDRITSLFVRGAEVWVGTANGLNVLEKSY